MHAKMKNLCALLFFVSTTLIADQIDDSIVAHDLYVARKWEDAVKIFVKLAEAAPKQEMKDNYRLYVFFSNCKQKKFDEAAKDIELINDAKVKSYARLHFLSETGQTAVILKEYAGVNLEEFPEKLQGDAFYIRANAYYYAARKYPEALADYEKAALLTAGGPELRKLESLCGVAAAACIINDEAKTVTAADKVLASKMTGVYLFFIGGYEKVKILLKNKKFAEAGEALDAIDLYGTRKWSNGGIYVFAYNEYRGDVFAGLGNTAKAKEFYENAAAIKVTEGNFKRIEEKLKSLRKEITPAE